MRQTIARCVRLELVGDYMRAHFQSDLLPAPGQFLLARLTPSLTAYLRIPFFPSSLSADSFTVDLPRETALTPETLIDIIGPCGKALAEPRERERVLLIADDSPAALLPLAAQALARAGAATVLTTEPYPLEALDPRIEVQHGALVPLLKEFAPYADRIFIHLSRFSSLTSHLSPLVSHLSPFSTYLLLVPPMPCGVGACQACYVKTNRGHKMSCLDGPFFSLQSLISNF